MQGSQKIKKYMGLKCKSIWYKAKLITQFVTLSLLFAQPLSLSYLHAEPLGGNVVGGSGSINQSTLTTTINQTSQNLAIDWQSFDVNTNEQVNFVQPNSSSIALNRILGNNGSTIQGQINANGQVILVNPNGVLFTSTATINAGGLIASSLDMSPVDFMNGNYIFNEVMGTDGAVINSGIINASVGGNIALIGKKVKNDGLISATLGSVVLAAGKQSILTFDNQGLIGVTVTKEILQEELGLEEAIINNGEIKAEGGRVLLTASVSQDVFSQAVNSNIDQATSVVVNADGSFTLGGGGDILNAGVIDVSSEKNINGDAKIIILAENVISSGTIKADTKNGDAGEIEIHSKNKTLLIEKSITSAQALATGKGGLVKILGDKVGLFDESIINVSGFYGGGSALIGGDRQGFNQLIRNSNSVYLGSDTLVKADAIGNGDGGKIITFANDTARLYGNLYARGGAVSGNGGFIETSGKRGFYITKTPDITATNGNAGHWLIDPNNIDIVSGASALSGITQSGSPPDTAFDSTDDTDAILNVGLILTALDGNNATVTITTSNPLPSNTTDGNIKFSTDLNYNGKGSDTLILNAANNIDTNGKHIWDADTASGTDKLNIVFNADADLSGGIGPSTSNGSGNVLLNDSRIYTNGGSFTATGQNFTSSRGNGDGGSHYLDTRDNTNNTKGGDVFIYAKGGVTLGAEIFTGGGEVKVGDTTVGDEIIPTSFLMNANGKIDTKGANDVNGGAISIYADSISSSGDFISEGGAAQVTGSTGHIGLNGGEIKLISSGLISVSGNIKANGSNGLYDDSDLEGSNGGVGAAITIESTANNIILSGDVESKGGDASGDNETGSASSPANGGSGGSIIIKALSGSVSIAKVKSEGGDAVGADVGQDTGLIPTGGSAGTITISSATSGTSSGMTLNDDIKAKGGKRGGDNDDFGISGNGNSITFNGPVVLTDLADNQEIEINASGGQANVASANGIAGDVAFKGAVSTSEPDRVLDFTVLAKKVDFEDSVGTSATHLKDIAITATGVVNASTNNIYASSLNVIQSSSFTSGLIETSSVTTNDGVDGGSVTVNSNGSIVISSIESQGGDRTTDGHGANGGSVLLSGESVTVGKISTFGRNSVIGGNKDGGDAGTITINATENISSPSVTLNGDVNASGGVGARNAGATQTAAINLTSSTTSLVTINHTTDFTTPVNVTASAGSLDTLTSAIRTNAFNVTNTGIGTLNSNLSFTSFEILNGNSDVDTFTLSGDIINQINGLAGNDIFNVNTTITGLIDGGSDIDELNGANVANYWDITAQNKGDIYTDSLKGTKRLSFDDIEKLIGGTGVDEFNLAFDVTDTINGMSGNDIFNIHTSVSGAMSGGLNNDTFNISSDYTGTLTAGDGNDTFRLITTGLTLTQQLDGGLGTDELIGANELNVWEVSNDNEGTLFSDTGKTTPRLTFTSFETITGNGGVDRFDLAADVSNQANGMGGQDIFNITSNTTGELNGGLNNDMFNIDSDFTGNANGDGGNDTFEINTSVAAALNGGDGDDIYDVNSAGLTIANIVGGNGTETTGDVINAFDETNYWDITGAGAGTIADSDVAPTRVTFSQIENLTGGDVNNDTFKFSSTSSSVTGVIDGGDSSGDNDIVDLSLAGLINDINLGPTVGYTNIEEFIGNGANSTITGENFDTTWTFTANDTGKVSYSTDGGITTTESKFTNFAKLNGGSAVDTYDLSFDVTSEINGNGGDDIYNITTDITGTMNGGDGNDTYNLNVTGLTITSIVGGNGTETTGDVINAFDETNYWDITGAGAGTIADSDVAPTRVTFSQIENLTGGDLNDDFQLADNLTNSGTIVGGLGINSLTAGNNNNFWDITAQNSGTIYTDSTRTTKRLDFSNIEILNGNADSDRFNLAFDISNQVNGRGGSDRFDIGTVITGAIDGGAANDNFYISNTGLILPQLIQGGTGIDTLYAANEINYWDITAQNSGSIYTDSTRTTKRLDFSSIESLNGNTAVDDFNLAFDITNQINGLGGNDSFTIGATITGVIAGGTGTDTLTAANVANFWDITSQNSGAIYTDSTRTTKRLDFASLEILNGNSLADDFNLAFDVTNQINGLGGNDSFTIGATITGVIAGGTGTDTLTAANVANFWDITSQNSGAIYTDSTRTTKRLDFSNIEILNGNAAVDRFNLAFDISNQVNGRGGSDRFDISAVITGVIDGGAANDDFYITNTDLILPQLIQGGLGTDTLYAANEINYWNLNSLNGGGIFSNQNMTANRLSFAGIESVLGNAEADTFLLNGSNNFTGSINGGGGVDKLTAGTRSNNWTITNANSGTVSSNSFTQIEELVGGGSDDHLQLHNSSLFVGTFDGAGGVDEIIGGDRSNTWMITEENIAGTEVAGTVTGLSGTLTGFTTGSFKNVETLTGNNNSDDYSLLTGSIFNGSINGQGGNNSLTSGDFATNTWTITASDTGTVTGLSGNFSNIQSITGGTFIDEITFNANGFITGLIDGNDIANINDSGHDVIYITAFTGDTIVKLGVKTTYENNVLNIDNVEQIDAADGGTSIVNTIVGDDRPNTWIITSDNTGNVQETGSNDSETKTAFSNFEIVHGGALDDAYQFEGTSQITDTLDGMGGVNSIDYSAVDVNGPTVVVNLNESGTGSNKIINVTGVKGNITNSKIIAKNGQVNTWDFYGTNRGEVDGVVFTDFNILEGGDSVDIFNFDGSSAAAIADPIVQTINLQVNGNAGDDTLNITLSDAERGLINFDGGTFTTSNYLIVDGGSSSYATTYSPNVALNTDQFSYTSGLNTFEVNYTNADNIQDSSLANTLELMGTSVSDTFTLTDTTFNVTATTPGYVRSNDITYSGKTNITITGGSGDIFELSNDLIVANDLTLDIDTINDNGNLITAAGLNLANTSKSVSQTLRTNISRLSADNTGDLYIVENDGVNITGLDTTSLVDINASGNVTSSLGDVLNSSGELIIKTSLGDIDLSASTNSLSGGLTLHATEVDNGDVVLSNNTATSIVEIITNNLNITSTGDITQTGGITATNSTSSALTELNSNGDILLAAANDPGILNDFDILNVTNANNVRITDVDDLVVQNINATGNVELAISNLLTTTNIIANSVTTSSTGLNIGLITANIVNLNSGSGTINGSGTNIRNASNVVLTATGGINIGLDTVGSLTATNSGSGDINVTKTGDLTLENVTNNNLDGDFYLVSNGGNLTVKKVNLGYDNVGAEANFEFNAVGNIYGDDATAPNITANRAIFNMKLSGSVGKSNAEPITLKVKDHIEATATTGTYIRFYNGIFDGDFFGENEYKNIALQIIDNLAGQQLIQVESLAEIDPAIFTDVRNYSNSDIALMMPADQRYSDSDDDEDEESKEKRKNFLNSTP